MRVRLSDKSVLPDLMRFFRAAGCIAFYHPESEEIEVIHPHAFGDEETRAIEEILDRWRPLHPNVSVSISRD